MQKKQFLIKFLSIVVLVANLAFLMPNFVQATQTTDDVPFDIVIKAKGMSTLYYYSSEGKRLVFPNEATYRSWFDDFSDITEISMEEISEIPLAGNVRYRPGVLLVKIKTDPRVYVVAQDGVLRWIRTEELAKKLYGQDWSLLVDDVPDAFFVNYSVGDPIDEENDFDPDQEEDNTPSIAHNLRLKFKERINQKKMVAKQKFCNRLEKSINRIQARLSRRGINLTIGLDYINQCTSDDDSGDQDDDTQDDSGDRPIVTCGWRKIMICHIPLGNPDAARTICVSRASLKAHLSQGDTIGACDSSEEPEDTAPPVISGINSNTQATTASITWTTSEDADSEVEYADESLSTASTTTSMIDGTLVTTHSIQLTELIPETTYYFIVKSADASSNQTTSSEMTFITQVANDTTPPVISNISVTTHATSTLITWTTNEASTSQAEYATSTLSTASTTLTVEDTNLVTSHSLTLTNLDPETTYCFMLTSADTSNNQATTSEDSFATTAEPDTTAPVISGITVTPYATSTLIVWTTDEDSDSLVKYATSTLATATQIQTVSDSNLVTSHQITLDGLTATTTYYFIVESSDTDSNTAVSSENTFTTLE